MKKIYGLPAVLMFVLGNCHVLLAQNSVLYGVEAKLNNAVQIFSNPQRPQAGFEQSGTLQTIGFGCWVEKQVFPYLSGIARVNYLRKGISDHYFSREFYFTAKYDCLDLDFLWSVKAKHRFIPNLYGGLRYGLVFHQKASSSWEFSPVSSLRFIDQSTPWKRLTGGWIFGFKYPLNNKFQIGIEMNRDISPLINTFAFQVHNQMVSLNVAYTFKKP